ncbi:MAG: hypothetical protein ACI9TK_000770 [Flavobacteriaceae bacterium]|jgi:hypothetical protein
MEKNYPKNHTDSFETELPRKIVLKRIMTFSKSHIAHQNENELLKILQN